MRMRIPSLSDYYSLCMLSITLLFLVYVIYLRVWLGSALYSVSDIGYKPDQQLNQIYSHPLHYYNHGNTVSYIIPLLINKDLRLQDIMTLLIFC